MKVAVIGGNFLGCATAFYVRKALDNSSESSLSAQNEHRKDASQSIEVHIFEASNRLGGNKFITRAIPGVADSRTPVGSACGVDVNSCPLFSELIRDANIEISSKGTAVPGLIGPQSYGLFHWDQDEFRVVDSDISLLTAASNSLRATLILQLYALLAMAAVLWYLHRLHVRSMQQFLDVMWSQPFPYYAPILCITSILLGSGIVPPRALLRLYNALVRQTVVALSVRTSYGADSVSAALVAKNFHNQLRTIARSKSTAYSAVSLGHLLSRCNLVRYSRMGTMQLLRDTQISAKFVSECVGPFMALDYGDPSFGANDESNSVASLLTLLSRSFIPPSLRANALHLDAEVTDEICPELANAARAQVHLLSRVQEIRSENDENESYSLNIVSADGTQKSLEGFNAVLICAAVCRTGPCTVSGLERPLEDMLAFRSDHSGLLESTHNGSRWSSRYSGLVHGSLNVSYFGYGSLQTLPAHITLLESAGLYELVQVSTDVYFITCGEKPTKTSSIVTNVFHSVKAVVSWQRCRRHGAEGSPIHVIDGDDCPDLILQKRLINVNCIDRVGNHPELDIISARNCASLLQDGVAQWK